MNAATLEQRLDRIESRFAIADLVTAYCIAYDDRDLAALRVLLADDLVFRSRDGQLDVRGGDALVALFERMYATRGISCHWTHNHVIRFDETDADRATGLLIGHAEMTPNLVPTLAAYRYEDVYVRIGRTWKFSRRELSFLYNLPLTAYLAQLPTAERVATPGGWRRADYPDIPAG